MLIVNSNISIPLKEFSFSYARSPGPGGQNVNKLNTKVTLRWDVDKTKCLSESVKERLITKYRRRINKAGEFMVVSHRFRDQGRNVADCLAKLREMIESVSVAPKKRKKTKPSKGATRRRLEQKRRKSAQKQSRRSPRFDD